MANTLLIQKTNNTFWHRHNNLPLTDRAISDFQVSIDSNLTIVELDGSTSAQYPITSVSIQVDGGAVETFTNRIALVNRLVALSYTPYIVNSGLTQDQINAIQSANVPSGSNPFATMIDVSGGTSLYTGVFPDEADLFTAVPVPVQGNFAWVLDPTSVFYQYYVFDGSGWYADTQTQARIDDISALGLLIGNKEDTANKNDDYADVTNPSVKFWTVKGVIDYIKNGFIVDIFKEIIVGEPSGNGITIDYLWVKIKSTVSNVSTWLGSGRLTFINNITGFVLNIDAPTITANNTQTFQDKSGVIALTSDIPVIGNWVDYSATSTIVGFSSFGRKNIFVLNMNNKFLLVQYDIEGVSNSTLFNFTIPNASVGYISCPTARLVNNGTLVLSTGIANTFNSSVVNLYLNGSQGGWMNGNAKGAMGQLIVKIS